MAFTFQPACRPMLLGSLPHRSAAQAITHIRKTTHELLAWPQLPQRSFRETNLTQAALGLPGLVIEPDQSLVFVEPKGALAEMDRLDLAYLRHDLSYAALAPEDISGLSEIQRQPEHVRGTHALKGQMMGPISLAAQLTDDQARPLIYETLFFEAIIHHLHLRAAWHVSQLVELNGATIMCLDEPFLEAMSHSFLPISWEQAQAAIEEVFSTIDGYHALYAGGQIDWARILHWSLDMIIADTFTYHDAFVNAGAQLTEFFDRGGNIGLGMIPTDAELLQQVTAEQLAHRIEILLESFTSYGISKQRFLNHSILTTQDSLGHLNVEMAEYAMQLLANTSNLIRQQYDLN